MFDPAFPNSIVSDNAGRCVAMTVPQFDGDLPMYRCVSVGTLLLDRRLVCEAYRHRLPAIRFCDDATN
jgi:ferric iron reductase protein FhuF